MVHVAMFERPPTHVFVCVFQQACGYEFTNKLHRMFTDMTISSDLNSKFDDFLSKESLSLGVNFSILVLQVGKLTLPKL